MTLCGEDSGEEGIQLHVGDVLPAYPLSFLLFWLAIVSLCTFVLQFGVYQCPGMSTFEQFAE